jgi:hypothetical protein
MGFFSWKTIDTANGISNFTIKEGNLGASKIRTGTGNKTSV